MGMNYDKLFELMKKQNITTYYLRKNKIIGNETLRKLQKKEGNIDTRTIEKLCELLNCQPGDIMQYVPDEI